MSHKPFEKDGELFVRADEPMIKRKFWSGGPDVDITHHKRAESKSANDRIGRDMVITTEHIDRDGDIVRTDDHHGGLDISFYMKDPIVLLQHGRGNEFPVIGGNAILERTEVDGVPGWIAREWLFGDTDLARQIKSLWDDMILRTSSIGFVPKTWFPIDGNGRRLDPDDPHSIEHMTGWDFASSELREWSIVAIPANPYASRKLWDAQNTKAREFFDLSQLKSASGATPTEERKPKQHEVGFALKDVSLERCLVCRGVVPYSKGAETFLFHRDLNGEACEGQTLGMDPSGPTLKTISDVIRDTTRHDEAPGKDIPKLSKGIVHAAIAANEISSIPAHIGIVVAELGECMKDGRVLSSKTRSVVESTLTQIEEAAVDTADAIKAMHGAAGSLREFLAAVDRREDEDSKAEDVEESEEKSTNKQSTSESSHIEDELESILSNDAVRRALERFKIEP